MYRLIVYNAILNAYFMKLKKLHKAILSHRRMIVAKQLVLCYFSLEGNNFEIGTLIVPKIKRFRKFKKFCKKNKINSKKNNIFAK